MSQRQRGTRDRLIQLTREGRRSPTLRSALGGILILVLALIADIGAPVSIVLATATALILFAILSSVAAIERETRNVGDAAAIASILGPSSPPLGTWAIEPDFGRLIIVEMKTQPQTVVECGSGVTTLLIAECLRSNGSGRLYSLEHDERYARQVSDELRARGLAEWVEFIVVPLKTQRFGDVAAAWYDRGEIEARLDSAIDLLIVDGPPSTERWSRWPVIEVLHQRLRVGAVVLLDDGRQRRERLTAQRWGADHSDLQLYWHDTVKGSWRLEKVLTTQPEAWITTAARTLLRIISPRPKSFGRWPVRR